VYENVCLEMIDALDEVGCNGEVKVAKLSWTQSFNNLKLSCHMEII